jgi:hypothetical protein
MRDGMAEVLALGASGDHRVPVEVELKSGKMWGGYLPWTQPVSEYIEEEELVMGTYLEYEPVHIELYLDHRDGAADNYSEIVLCDECADGLGGEVVELTRFEPGEAAECDKCGRRNVAVMLSRIS